MRTQIKKWGNSLGVRIPCSLANAAGVRVGSEVEISMREGDLVIQATPRRKYRLAALLRRVTTANLPDAVDTGKAVAREIW